MKTIDKGLRLRIVRDEGADSPREFDNIGTMVCWHHRYRLGDVRPTDDPADWRADFDEENPDALILSLYLYDHGGVTMSVEDPGCRWDSGQVGWIYVTAEKIKAEFGDAEGAREKAEACLRAEVKVYASHLEGDVWRFVVERVSGCAECGTVGYDHEDSCGGFYGDDKDGIREHLSDEAKPLLDEAWDNRGGE
jgi:hypothetical protein